MFAKYPTVGQVKTRMTKTEYSSIPIAVEEATELYEAFLSDLIHRFAHTNHFSYQVRLGLASSATQLEFAERYQLQHHQIKQMPTHLSDLGELMEHCFRESHQAGFSKTVLIGSDIPHLSIEEVKQAFVALSQEPMVIGPDAGGGMYLIGYRTPLGILANGIEWSRGKDCEAVQQLCKQQKIKYRLLGTKQDFDTTDDIRQWYQQYLQFPQTKQNQCKTSLSTSFAKLEKIALVEGGF